MARREEQAIEDFSKPQKIYSDYEIQDFHNKIQRFWVGEPREVVTGIGVGLAQKFDHEALHVAFGAARKVPYKKSFVYQYNSERYSIFNDLWIQYEDWRSKQDWMSEKEVERLEAINNEVVF